ncbi:MAG: LLM class flavin-dependent oxidoreductase [Pseudomonadota bacterium]
MQLWTLTIASPRGSADYAARAEAAGWHGMMVVDSQNLSGDSYVALAMASTTTSQLGLGTGVTNTVTRHPAVTAGAIASIQKLSGGRAVLGISRGDSALAHLGHAPAKLHGFETYLSKLQRYLRGESVPFSESDIDTDIAPLVADLDLADTPESSKIEWLRSDEPKVPVEVAATGPKVIAISARHADCIMFTLGADETRLKWGIETARGAAVAAGRDPDTLKFGAYINMACHNNIETARKLVRGGLTTFARFSVMHGDISGPVDAGQTAVLEQLHDSYNMKQHTRNDSQQAETLTPEFIDRFGIVGDPAACINRLEQLRDLGMERLAISGPTMTARSAVANEAATLLTEKVLPHFH